MYLRRDLKKTGQQVFTKHYLLRGIDISLPNHVVHINITYNPIRHFMAILNVYNCQIVGLCISDFQAARWCFEVLQEAIEYREVPGS